MRRTTLGIIAGLVLLGAACSGGNSANSADQQQTVAPPATSPPTSSKAKQKRPYGEVIEVAIADVQDYWNDTLPEVYGQAYETIPKSRIFAVQRDDTLPACAPGGGTATYEDVKENAYYCTLGQFVAWDDEGLIPRIYDKYGEYAVAMVFAHEWGHAIQDQMGFMTTTQSIVRENQADCFAGSWTAHALDDTSKTGFGAKPSDLQAALAGMLEFRDEPGSEAGGAQAHGSGFDRVNGFQVGFEQGAAKCATWPDDPPPFTEFAFSDEEELQTGGNLDYARAVDLATHDLNAYWKSITTKFQAVDSIAPFSADTSPPSCGGKQYSSDEVSGTAFFCVEDNYVAWDITMLQDVNDEIGDFGLAAVLAEQWTASFQHQNGQTLEQINAKLGHLQRACFTGSWTRAVWEGDTHNEGLMQLSPGDLDEAVKAFLAFSETPDEKGETETGSAFEQVAAFRDGFLSNDGALQCETYREDDAKGSKD